MGQFHLKGLSKDYVQQSCHTYFPKLLIIRWPFLLLSFLFILYVYSTGQGVIIMYLSSFLIWCKILKSPYFSFTAEENFYESGALIGQNGHHKLTKEKKR